MNKFPTPLLILQGRAAAQAPLQQAGIIISICVVICGIIMFTMVVLRARLPCLKLCFPLQVLPRDPRLLSVRPPQSSLCARPEALRSALCTVTLIRLRLQQNSPSSPACKEEHDSELKLPQGTFWELPMPGDTGVWLASLGRTPCHTYPPGTAKMSAVLLSTAQQCKPFRAGKSQFRYKYQSK